MIPFSKPLAMNKRHEFTPEEIERLNHDLKRQLGPEFLSQRTGPGGKFTYIEGQSAIHLANELFGFNGWTSELRSLTVDFMDEHDGRVDVGVSAIVRITLKDGTFHEDVGYGQMENSKSKGAAMEKAKKEAATDALKRALRMFGNVLGNCIYDKNYTSRMQYVKKPGLPNIDIKNLYRDKRCAQPEQQQQQQQDQIQPLPPPQKQQHPQPQSFSIPSSSASTFSSAATLVNPTQQSNQKQPSITSSPNNNNTINNNKPLPRLTRSTSRLAQAQQQRSGINNNNKNKTPTTSATTVKTTTNSNIIKKTTTPIQNKKTISNNNHKDIDMPVVSPLPPNEAPLLKGSSLSRNDSSFSMEGDDAFYAEVIAQEKDYDKPDIESQPVSDDPAYKFSWSTSGDNTMNKISQGNNNNKRKLETSSPQRKSIKARH